jgi:hypothetical protein
MFQVHGMNERGKPLLRKQLKRDQVAVFFANQPPCLIGMEACSSSHYRARKLESLSHTVRLMAPQFVKPYVKSNKNDAAMPRPEGAIFDLQRIDFGWLLVAGEWRSSHWVSILGRLERVAFTIRKCTLGTSREHLLQKCDYGLRASNI